MTYTMDRHLVTGAGGSGGSYMAEYLMGKGEVYGIGRWHSSPVLPKEPPFSMYECDLMDRNRICDVIEDCEPDYIYHLASHANVRAAFDNPSAVLNNNIGCTLNLLEAVRRVKPDTVILLCSSSEVYGQVNPGIESVRLDENWPKNPVSPYAVSKGAQDMMGYAWFKSYGLRIIRTRAFTYINPRRSDLFATSFAMQVAEIERGKREILRHGNLNSVRTMLDVRDTCRAYHLAATEGTPGEVYNIGGTETMTVKDFLRTLQDMATVPILCKQDPALMRPVDVTLQIPDCSRFRKKTGWKPEIPFRDSVKHLLDHCRSVA